MKKSFAPAIVLIALLQSGCVTHYQNQPRVEGRVLDRHGQPLAGVGITLESNAGASRIVSDRAGRFSFPAKHEWAFYLPLGPMDWMHRAQLRIQTATRQYDYFIAGGLGNSHVMDGAEFGVICQLPATTQLPPPEVCHGVDIHTVKGDQPPN